MAYSLNSDNGAGGDVAAWDKCRQLWNNAGILAFPWLHCRTMQDIQRLITIAKQENGPAIGLNIEDVVGDSLVLREVADLLRAQWSKPVHMATLCWVQNGQGWQNLDFVIPALEIFVDEVPACARTQDCIDHAYAEGLQNVTLMLKTKPPNAAETYGEFFSICHSLYTADDITPSGEAWNLWKAETPCKKTDTVPDPWYSKPYLEGPPVGPDKLPRALYPPSAGKGTFTGNDVMAYKRGISRAGRQEPWSPSTWSYTYGESFAMGDGSGNVGKSGVRGFQRQTWPDDKDMQTGNMGDKTYQKMRRALVSNPEAPNYKEPIFDATAVELLKKAAAQYQTDAKIAKFRSELTDFCQRAELASSAKWQYSQKRPYSGLGVPPENAHENDCSSYVIIAYYWARTHSQIKAPDPSKYEYTGYGNTWDDLDGHPKVSDGQYLVGDLAHYEGHVTLCKKAGDANSSRWSSFGSEPKPEEKTLHYRPDFLKVVRPPLQ
jgi:hypothetical protein